MTLSQGYVLFTNYTPHQIHGTV